MKFYWTELNWSTIKLNRTEISKEQRKLTKVNEVKNWTDIEMIKNGIKFELNLNEISLNEIYIELEQNAI